MLEYLVKRIDLFSFSVSTIIFVCLFLLVYRYIVLVCFDLFFGVSVPFDIPHLNPYKNSKAVFFFVFIPDVFFLAPVIEEFIFRATLVVFFDSLTFWAWTGIVFSAVIFSAMHWQNNLFLSDRIINCLLALGVGMMAGFLGVWSQSIWICVLVHFTCNLFVAVLGYFKEMHEGA